MEHHQISQLAPDRDVLLSPRLDKRRKNQLSSELIDCTLSGERLKLPNNTLYHVSYLMCLVTCHSLVPDLLLVTKKFPKKIKFKITQIIYLGGRQELKNGQFLRALLKHDINIPKQSERFVRRAWFDAGI